MKKNLFNFTHNELMKIKPPKKGREKYKDAKEQGLVLIASYGGSKVFYYGKKIDGDYKLLWIGHFPEVSIADARKKATEFKTLIANGIDPTEKPSPLPEEVTTELTFKELFDRYVNDHAQYKIERYKDIIADMKRQASHLFERKISTIQREDMQEIFNNLTKEGKFRTANLAIQRFKRIFNKAIEWELLEKNPAIGIAQHKEVERDRYITSEEKPAFFEIVEKEANPLMKDYLLISLYTGARKSNVLSMEWPEINLTDKTWHIPAHKSKNGIPHLLPLTEKAIKILSKRKKEKKNNKWVFPSPRKSKSGHFEEPQKSWHKIRQKAGIPDVRIHDIRRTMGSWMAINGASQYIIGKALNHKSYKSTEIYARLSIDPVREFMEKATNSITDSKAKKPAKSAKKINLSNN
ncbi:MULTISPECIES: tyrosine-type recombinase/integrase [unclassified Rickettsia]|uniref:tyrosine-type recombinase/integrase n=1 Tax=unclassified Rickettsia TaxID=114295 RepID=UPI0031335327